MPRVSVVMSVYNGQKYLKESIESILNQTYKDFEFVIINDGSNDNSKKIIESFSNKRIMLISRENKGLIFSLNQAIGVAKGQYLARMDADDISDPTRFQKQVEFMDAHPDVALCGTWAKIINQAGHVVGQYKTPTASTQIRRAILFHNPFIHPTVMFRRSIINEIGNYNPHFKNIEDYELWTRIVYKYNTANIGEFLISYRTTKESITQSKKTQMRLKGILVRFLALLRFFER